MTDSVYDLTQSYVDGDIDRQTLRRKRKLEIERLVRKHRYQATGHPLAKHPILANIVNNAIGFFKSSIAIMRNNLFISLAVILLFVSLMVFLSYFLISVFSANSDINQPNSEKSVLESTPVKKDQVEESQPDMTNFKQPAKDKASNYTIKEEFNLLKDESEKEPPEVAVDTQHSGFTNTETTSEQEQAKTDNSANQTSTKKKSDDDSN